MTATQRKYSLIINPTKNLILPAAAANSDVICFVNIPKYSASTAPNKTRAKTANTLIEKVVLRYKREFTGIKNKKINGITR